MSFLANKLKSRMRYEKQNWQLAFYFTWGHLTNDTILHSFFGNNRQAFIDHFTTVIRKDDEGNFYRADYEGYELNVIFHTIYEMIAKNLHPDPPGRHLTNQERDTIFSGLEYRPTRFEDLTQSILKEEAGYKEKMKSMYPQIRLYGHLYFHLYKGMVEHLLTGEEAYTATNKETKDLPQEPIIEENREKPKIEVKKEVEVDLLFNQIKEAKLTVNQACLLVFLFDIPAIGRYREIVLACGFSEGSISKFKAFHEGLQNIEGKVSNHDSRAGKNLSQVIAFLKRYKYDASEAEKHYRNFRTRAYL